jgi:hypothetical protein
VVSLRNLSPVDARAYLRGVGVARGCHDDAIALTHGHPLALTLLAEVLARSEQPGRVPATLLAAPDVVRALLDRVVDAIPSPRHRRALAVCAHARFTTEPMLREAMREDDSAELFGWLRALTFVEEGPYGLFPHDIARDALEADLRWRDPATHSDVHRGVRRHIAKQLHAAAGLDQQRWASDSVFLNRHVAAVSSFWDWTSFGNAYGDSLRPVDRTCLLTMTARHQGSEQAELVEFWLDRQPDRFLVVRSKGGEPIGFMAELALHCASQADIRADPGTCAMWEYAMRHGPTAPGVIRCMFGTRTGGLDGREDRHRMDGRNLESGYRLHACERGLRQLLCSDVG